MSCCLPRFLPAPFSQVLMSLLLVLASAAAALAEQPNVLLIMTDDQGWGDLSSHGNPHLNTPRLDALAAAGARFDRFFVSPVCAPTRASLLTGRYHLRTNVHGVTRGQENMRAEEVTIAEAFQTAGYATGCFGKWHNGRHYPMHPNGQGFDEFVGFCGGHWNNYFDATLEHNGNEFTSDGYITDVLTDFALKFIERNREQPFFCYVPYNAPHSPWQVPDEYWNRFKDREELPPEARCAYAMCENIDDNVGRLLDALDRLKLADNTIVLFLTDNGPNSDRFNADMRGRKGSVHEGGIRVPLFVRWPGKISPGTRIDRIAMHIDLFPTLAELAGIESPETLPQDGRSLAPLLTREDPSDWPDRTLLTFRTGANRNTRGSVRTQQFRAVFENPRRGWELFDMQADPAQTTNIADEHPQIVNQLKQTWERACSEFDLESLQPLPVPVGHHTRPRVEMPGNEALFIPAQSQGISYHGRNGWANDWVDNWTDPNAFPYWNLNVATAGTYTVSIKYTCPDDAVGTQLEIRAGGDATTGTIREAHDPDPLPPRDLVSRKETYDKIWKVIPLGTLTLPEGPTRLSVHALNKPGQEVVELKSVILERQQ